MNINTEWNEEPAGVQPMNLSWIPSAWNAGSWALGQAAGMFPSAVQGMPTQTPDQMVEDDIRKLRQERARQSYEQRFGVPFSGGASMYAMGDGAQVDAMRQRVRNWRTSGRRGM